MTTKDDAARNTAVIADLNDWWKKATEAPTPEKPGTVTPARTFTFRGRVHKAPKHVQTKAEYEEDMKDVRWAEHKRSIVRGFDVNKDTVTVVTNLTRNSTFDLNEMDKRDAQDLCHELGGFVWAREYRHWGLKNIRITSEAGEVLSSRMGGGNVR